MIEIIVTNMVVLLAGMISGHAEPMVGLAPDPLDSYNVVWTTPSENAHGSMPLGNGDVGINAWVEANGDLIFYVSKTNAWDENARLCKIGRVRVKFDPPLAPKDGFRQELKLREGCIEIGGQRSEVGGQRAGGGGQIRIWVDSDQPVVRVEAESAVPVTCRAEVELWRLRELPLSDIDEYSHGDGKNPVAQSYNLKTLTDVVVPDAGPRLVWYHRNTRSAYPVGLEVQHLEALKGKFTDPLLNHTFGASMRGVDMVPDGTKALKSTKPAKRQQLSVCVLAERAETPDAWLKDLGRIFDKCTPGHADGFLLDTNGSSLRLFLGQESLSANNCLKTGQWQHVAVTLGRPQSGGWIIYVDGKVVAKRDTETAPPSEVTNGYVLQRFMNACSGRGASPIKFNGSIFTVEKVPGASPETPDGNPDWRCWGGPYWFQNTRLSYWPMLATGDFEMMEPWFRMYREALPLSKARMEAIYNFKDAASFQETMHFWGMPTNRDYGWGHPGPEPGSACIHRYWSGGLELTAYMLDRYDFTQDEAFARDTLVPLADPIIAFFDQYWPKRDSDGKILFDPAQATECMPNTVNPMPDIAGLRCILPRLLALLKTLTTEAQRTRWTRILQELPPLPVAVVDGVKLLRPSSQSGAGNNGEHPELYAVFPYRLFGVGKPDLDLARVTYEKRSDRNNYGWCHDSIQAACLGLGDEAGRQVALRARSHRAYRFPAMWLGFDWIPDQNHGCNILTTLQTMLLQSDGQKIYVLPAWPKNWDVSFRASRAVQHDGGRQVQSG
ncbi:MAG: DUF5703 domain-containing protein [Verrucomicrobia bacterium]|nr:DUF5703 domain-containing protein [Verrucomicrobiota bacterium]